MPPRLLSLFENPPLDPNTPGITKLTRRQIDKMYRPFVGDIGYLIVSWNRLQETLARLFWFVTGIQDGAMPLAIWHSTKDDRTQRAMLRAAAEIAFSVGRIWRDPMLSTAAQNKRAFEDIVWIITRADALADLRNTVVHSPFLVSQDTSGKSKPTLTTHTTYGNPRALRLRDKNLKDEFRWYRGQADALVSFAREIATRIRWPDRGPWPDRPRLPHLGQSQTLKAKRRKKLTK